MTNVADIYKALAVRINYPVTPTYRCMQKVIGYLNLLISLSNTPQVVIEVALSGPKHKRYYKRSDEKIAYLLNGKACKLNPDGTIDTADESAYVIRTGLFQNLSDGSPKTFITDESDILADDYYLQPILTALYLVISGVQPSEAVMYINDACTKSVAEADVRQVDMRHIKRRL